jgi:hypothetical protein
MQPKEEVAAAALDKKNADEIPRKPLNLHYSKTFSRV